MGTGTEGELTTSVHFVHVMKTGGTSFLTLVRERIGGAACWPPDDQTGGGLYSDVEQLRTLTEEQRRRIRFYSGHHPYIATELTNTDLTMTVLRDPVERAISLLREWRRSSPDLAGATLEDLYDDIWKRGMLIWEYQVRQFAKRHGDDLHQTAGLVIDDERMELALAHLERVDVFGLQERYEEFEAAALDAIGWEHEPFPRRRVSIDRDEAGERLRRRIVEDNPADQEFYRRAVALYERRGPRSTVDASGTEG